MFRDVFRVPIPGCFEQRSIEMAILSTPEENLSILDSVAIVVGVVVGVGIFKTPSLVASVSDGGAMFLLFWILGGLISFVGALCYAELTSTYPNAGGDYHFLKNAFGHVPAFLFAWSRMTVIQSGSIAMVAFLIGDYASAMFRLGPVSNAIYAIAAVVILTSINLLGMKQGKRTQNLLMSMIVLGILSVVCFSLLLTHPADHSSPGNILPGKAALGTAMIFVLLTYGGWNEAAFISAEVNAKKKNMLKVLVYSIAIITFVYLVVNIALMRGLGLSAMAESKTVVADLMKQAAGDKGATFITILVLIAALSTVNAMLITGSRTNYALGRDYSFLKFLGDWQGKRSTPMNALLVQGAIAVALILFGAGSRDGFVLMIEYTAPVFWFFLFLVGVSVFVLRVRHPDIKRAFRVPFYPFAPALFCLVCLYMLHSSIVYTGTGSLAGVGVLLTGIPLLLLQRKKQALP